MALINAPWRTPNVTSEIPRRDVRFQIDSRVPRYWYRGWCQVTRFFDAFSIMFPLGEKFFIDNVKYFRDEIPSEAPLSAAIEGFIYQEAAHIREHRYYNQRLAEQGAPIEELEALIRQRQQHSHRLTSAKTRLAMTACLEHYTAILAHQLLRRPEILEGTHPTMAAIWRWHAIEETEHKAVAFDVLTAIEPWKARRYLLRCGAMLLISVYFFMDLVYFIYRLCGNDQKLSNWRGWWRLQWWLFVCPGVLTCILPAWLRWFMPGFHPDKIDSRAVLQSARQSLDERG